MSSTPLLERTIEDTQIEWVEVVAPVRRSKAPSSANLVIAIGNLRTAIEQGQDDSITIETDDFRELDEADIAAARYAADVWDD